MRQLGELQAHLAEIRALDGEVIALSSRGDQSDVQRTRTQLNLTYPIIAAPITKIIKDYDLWTNQYGTSYGTVIIDKRGVVRFVHNSLDESNRASVSEIRRVLQEIRQ